MLSAVRSIFRATNITQLFIFLAHLSLPLTWSTASPIPYRTTFSLLLSLSLRSSYSPPSPFRGAAYIISAFFSTVSVIFLTSSSTLKLKCHINLKISTLPDKVFGLDILMYRKEYEVKLNKAMLEKKINWQNKLKHQLPMLQKVRRN
jgi:hypothetical protein